MRFSEILEDYDKIADTLLSNGYKELGRGADASVWTKDVGSVIKIIVPEEGVKKSASIRTFIKFYEFCMQHQDIECLPKFIPIQGKHYTKFNIGKESFIQISMEELYPIKKNSFDEAVVWYLSDYVTSNIPWETVNQNLSISKNYKLYVSGTKNTDMVKLANTWKSLPDNIRQKYQLLYTVMQVLYSSGKINKLNWDLHTENIMRRKDGTLVITDPWFNEG